MNCCRCRQSLASECERCSRDVRENPTAVVMGRHARMVMQHKIKSQRLRGWRLVVFVSLLLARPSWCLPAQASPSSHENVPASDPPARVARISQLKGKVSFLRAGVDQWSEAALN